ncbi:PREDICTED: uncharacterized protein LOC109115574 [Nelumbo nucifera]|uniref:Uncharacterized protein LOC109115574 n=1 Tax=Nelumbo nucifera TaxID=4432 RepID=A0A1U8Q9V0_NELNU|nr:PREDICTED: uncharacterized protein LOC109115574 [Nelumbo nucifera]
MHKVFRGFLRKFVLVFLDDILVYSRATEEHIKHLLCVLSTLKAHKLHAKRNKCCFGVDKVSYRGHVISFDGVEVSPSKIECMVKWLRPNSPTKLRGFQGLTGYFRKFVQDYGKLARPLTRLLKKGAWGWNPEVEDAFQRLKEVLTSTLVLALLDFSYPFELECDALGAGIGTILSQLGRSIAFFSQALNPANTAKSTYDKELLAVVTAIQRWRQYLLGQQFVVKSDHQSLGYLLKSRITTLYQQRLLSKIMG